MPLFSNSLLSPLTHSLTLNLPEAVANQLMIIPSEQMTKLAAQITFNMFLLFLPKIDSNLPFEMDLSIAS